MPDIYVCKYQELVLPYNISVVGHLMLVQHKNSLKRRQDSSSVVQVSDSIKYKQTKKQTFVSMLISGASLYIYMFYRLTHALYYRKQKNTFYI